MKITLYKSTFIYYHFMLLYILLSAVYFYIFAFDISNYVDSEGFFQRALNIHDYKIYLNNLYLIIDNNVLLTLNNDFGIAYIYYFLTSIVNIKSEDEIVVLSFLFNAFVFILTSYYYLQITKIYNLNLKAKITFFIGLHYIYFMQLINKDMLTMLIFTMLLYYGLKKNIMVLIFLIPISFFIRLHLVIFEFIFLSLLLFKYKKFQILFFYISTSVLAAYLSIHAGFIGENLGGGLSGLALMINSNYYYMGYIILNPLRLLQWIQDVYFSFYFITESDGLDTSAILRIPILIVLIYYGKLLIKVLPKLFKLMYTDLLPIISLIIAYTLTWLMNPTVSGRYVMLIIPFIILLLMIVEQNKKKEI